MTDESNAKLGFAVIGCGGISESHLKAVSQEPAVRLVAVVDTDAAKAHSAAERFGAGTAHTSWEPIWRDADIRAVILCLPHELHAPAAISALRAGKHVLVEKPIANTVAEAEEMIAAAEAHEKILMVGHMKRFNRAVVTVKRNIEAGNIGQPFSFESIWYGPREIMPGIPWVLKKEGGGGGPLMGFGTHHVDILRWILGEVAEVSCFATCAVVENSEVEDTAVVSMRFRNGAIGVIHFTWARCAENFHEHMRFLGSRGEIAVKDGCDVSMVSEPRFGDRKVHSLVVSEEAGDLHEDQFTAQLAHFVDCIQNGRTPLNDGVTACKTLAVIEAAYRSAETGRTERVTD